MSDTNVPMQPVQPIPEAGPGAAEGPCYSHLMVQYCQSTQKWVSFLAILVTVLYAIVIVVLLVMIGVGSFAAESLPGLGGLGAAESVGMAAFYIALMGVYVPALVHLYRYSAHLKRFAAERSMVHLENALGSQKSFWKYAGILCIVSLGFMALAMVVAIPAALSGR